MNLDTVLEYKDFIIPMGGGLFAFSTGVFLNKFRETDRIKNNLRSIEETLRHQELTITELKIDLVNEKKDRADHINTIEKRVHDFMQQFRTEIKSDLRDHFIEINQKIDDNNKQDKIWRTDLAKELAQIILHKELDHEREIANNAKRERPSHI